jgi:hypothetical protein
LLVCCCCCCCCCCHRYECSLVDDPSPCRSLSKGEERCKVKASVQKCPRLSFTSSESRITIGSRMTSVGLTRQIK